MRVAVIGAGIAGLVAARDLTAGGHEVVVIEKSRGLGGRMAARRVEGMVLDHGLPVLEVPSPVVCSQAWCATWQLMGWCTSTAMRLRGRRA